MPKYWVVGASWGGRDDQTELFLRRGYWYFGWSDEEQPHMAKLREQIEPGDRIAIKQMLGQGSPNIKIKALGIVREVDKDDKRVYVNWLLANLNREVPGKGCFGSIHGPFSEEDDWVKEVFHI
jgi:hypothetical protein